MKKKVHPDHHYNIFDIQMNCHGKKIKYEIQIGNTKDMEFSSSGACVSINTDRFNFVLNKFKIEPNIVYDGIIFLFTYLKNSIEKHNCQTMKSNLTSISTVITEGYIRGIIGTTDFNPNNFDDCYIYRHISEIILLNKNIQMYMDDYSCFKPTPDNIFDKEFIIKLLKNHLDNPIIQKELFKII